MEHSWILIVAMIGHTGSCASPRSQPGEKSVIAIMSAKKLRLRKRYAAQKRIKERKLYAADVKIFDKANFQFAGRSRAWILQKQ